MLNINYGIEVCIITEAAWNIAEWIGVAVKSVYHTN